jgi:hypothetical protein
MDNMNHLSLIRLKEVLDYGIWPQYYIDHRDRVRTHNWISNLREASHAQNMRNRGTFRNNISGHRGILWHKQKWRARISFDKQTYELGYYSELELAIATRIQAQWDFHGDFSPEYN